MDEEERKNMNDKDFVQMFEQIQNLTGFLVMEFSIIVNCDAF